ncbi:MAG: corrinoid protein [Candidatus Aminicenantaceae bacterium]
MNKLLEEIKDNIISGRIDSEDEGFDGTMAGQPGVIELVQKAIEENIPASEIVTQSINKGMEEVGRLYESGEYLTPDMLASAECVSEAMKLLEPLLIDSGTKRLDKFIIATVEGDLHDIGKNIVATLLRGSGYKVIDLGTGVPADKIVNAVSESDAKYLGLSALLTTTMNRMKDVIDKLKEAGVRDKVKIFIGGAPVSEEYAKKIGADFYCEDAFDAVNKLS